MKMDLLDGGIKELQPTFADWATLDPSRKTGDNLLSLLMTKYEAHNLAKPKAAELAKMQRGGVGLQDGESAWAGPLRGPAHDGSRSSRRTLVGPSRVVTGVLAPGRPLLPAMQVRDRGVDARHGRLDGARSSIA